MREKKPPLKVSSNDKDMMMALSKDLIGGRLYAASEEIFGVLEDNGSFFYSSSWAFRNSKATLKQSKRKVDFHNSEYIYPLFEESSMTIRIQDPGTIVSF